MKTIYTYIDVLPEIGLKANNYFSFGVGFNIGKVITIEEKVTNGWTKNIESSNKIEAGGFAIIRANYKKIGLFCRYNHGLIPFDSYELRDNSGNTIATVNYYNQNI